MPDTPTIRERAEAIRERTADAAAMYPTCSEAASHEDAVAILDALDNAERALVGQLEDSIYVLVPDPVVVLDARNEANPT